MTASHSLLYIIIDQEVKKKWPGGHFCYFWLQGITTPDRWFLGS